MSRSVGEFALVGHLGEGSFATVFLARQQETGREFAMKAISRARVQGKLQENLESEISILKSFRHDNIVELYDIKKTERHIYLVLEYCAGGDLRVLIRKEGKLTEPTARHFMRHLGSGLHFLWSKNLVHRDLKPQNLLLTGPGLDATLKIADFGFARHLAQASMAETICGSPLYMAPEILQGHKYGAKADLWSVGAILFEMLSGKPPFGGANQIQLLANIRRGPHPPAREGFYPMPDGVPLPGRSCGELLCRLLVPDPQNRASFREFFHSDVLRLQPADGAVEGGGSLTRTASQARRDPARTPPGNSPSLAGREGGGAVQLSRGDVARTPERVATSGAVEYSRRRRSSDATDGGGQRASVSQQCRGPTDVLRSPKGQQGHAQNAQGQARGNWWSLAGWRWGGGGGGGGGGGRDGGAGSRAGGLDDEGGFAPLTRTFSDPPAVAQHHHHRNRLQTPPNALQPGVGGGEYYRQRNSSRGAWPQSTATRPPLTPPSPAQGSISASRRGSLRDRGGGGGAVPIPIRQDVSNRSGASGAGGGGGGGDYGGRGYDDGDSREREPWSPSDGSGYPSSSHWSRYGGPAGVGGGPGDRDGGEMSPSRQQSHDQHQRLRSHGPSSAPEVSYMGYAASRAPERGVLAAAAAAAGLRGVAFSVADGDNVSSISGRRPQSGDVEPAARRPSPQGGMRVASRDAGDDLPLGRHSRVPSLDLGGGKQPPPELSPRGSEAGGGAKAAATKWLSPGQGGGGGGGYGGGGGEGGQQLSGTSQTAGTVAGSFQALSSSPPDRYPVQLAGMVGAQRQRNWGGPGTTAAAAAASPGGVGGGGVGAGTGFVYTGGVDVSGGGGGHERARLRTRFEQETLQQQGQGRRGDISDGSGGSDDFVMVDGTASDHVGPAGGGGGGVGGHHVHAAYRLEGGGGDADPRSLGLRLVAAGGRWALGASVRGGKVAQLVGDARGAGAPPLSLEGILRCLQIVELFGRRAVLLAQLGDSRVAPAMRCRRKESLEAHARAVRAWGADTGSGAPDAPGDSLRGLQFAVSGGSFAQTAGASVGAFSADNPPKPPLSAVQGGSSWYPAPSSRHRAPNSDPILGDDDNDPVDGTGDGFSSGVDGHGGARCDGHRLFGEALVLYLKSLSMAKEAIVWGNQALESLPVSSNSSSSSRHHQPPPPSSPVASPVLPSARQRSPRDGSGSGTAQQRGDIPGRGQGHQQQQQQHRQSFGSSSRTEMPPPPPRPHGSGRVGAGSVASPVGGGGSVNGGGASFSPSSSCLSSEAAQVAAWGASLLGWLTGQFSTVLRRAERCRTELRGSQKAAAAAAAAAAVAGTASVGMSATSSTVASTAAVPGAEQLGARVATAGAGDASSSETRRSSAEGAPPVSSPMRSASSAGGGMVNNPTGAAAAVSPTAGIPTPHEASASHSRSASVSSGFSSALGRTGPSYRSKQYGAAPGAVALSARDIVVRAALAQAQESAASEVLGMWEPARKGYEQAALLLETLLLDALVARPEKSSTGPNRSNNNVGKSGAVSPRRGWGAGGTNTASGESMFVSSSGGGGGVLSEADQRSLQAYMTRFARRASEVAAIEKEEAKAAGVVKATASTMADSARDPARTESGQGLRMEGVAPEKGRKWVV